MQKKGELADGRYREDIVQKVVVRAGGGVLKDGRTLRMVIC